MKIRTSNTLTACLQMRNATKSTGIALTGTFNLTARTAVVLALIEAGPYFNL